MPANNTDENATQPLTIQGKSFVVPLLYVAGPCELSEGEAAALNQTYAENIRNNFASLMKRAAEGENPKELTQEDLDAYADEYEFGKRSGGARGPRDPVGSEEKRLALTAIKAKVEEKGKKWADLAKEKQEALLKQVLDAGTFRAKAEKIVAERREAAESIGELDLDAAA